MLGYFRKQTTEQLQKKAKSNYEKACSLSTDTIEAATFRLRISALSKAHIDKTFVAAAETTRFWQDACTVALTNGSKRPEPPRAKYYQLVNMAGSGMKTWTWIPEAYTDEIFALGSKYQTVQISAELAIVQVQSIADRICCEELKLDSAFSALDFLREDLE